MKFFSNLPVGVRQVLTFICLFYVAALILGRLGIIDLYSWVSLRSPEVWKGHVWQVLTYWLLSVGVVNFVMNTVVFLVLAPRLEKEWSRWELWSFCFISAVGAGLAKVFLMPHSQMALTGLMGVNFGLLAAWLKLFGKEEVLFLGLWSMSVREMALIVIIVSFLVSNFAELLNTFIPVCGGIFAWIYLLIRWRTNSAARARAHSSDRISRLEL